MRKKYLKVFIVSLLMFGFTILYFSNINYSQAKFQYIGIEKCATICHKSEKQGSQLGIWQESKHSKAFVTLATPFAKELLKKAGKEGDPQKSPVCLECHSTGYGKDKSTFAATFKIEEGVTCEACHGPGSAYRSISIMKDKEKFLASGGIIPKEKDCLKCHTPKAHQLFEFKFEERAKKIAHPVPKK